MELARVIKGPDEIRAMRCAIASTEIAMGMMQKASLPGLSENDIWAVLHAENIRPMALYQRREHEDALKWSRRAVGHNPKHIIALRYLLASLGMTGNTEEATALAQEIVAIDPSENISFFERRSAYASKRRTKHLCDGLRRAGLPQTP